MQILIEPLGGDIPDDYFQQLGRFIERGLGLTEAIVFDREPNGLAAPTSYLFDDEDQLVATLVHVSDWDGTGAVFSILGNSTR